MRLAHQATAVFNGHISFRPHTAHCWLTLRSTGHFAAVGLWPSFHSRPKPNLRKTPVSSNVMRWHSSLSSWSPLRLPSGIGTLAVLLSFTSGAPMTRHLSLKRFYRGHVSLPQHESFRAPPGHRLPGSPTGSRSAPCFVPLRRANLRATHNHSLNRTFCGVGQFGFISFSPNCPTPQNAG